MHFRHQRAMKSATTTSAEAMWAVKASSEEIWRVCESEREGDG